MKKKITSAILITAISLSIIACSGDSFESETSAPPSSNYKETEIVSSSSIDENIQTFQNEYFSCVYDSSVFSIYENASTAGMFFNISSPYLPDVEDGEYNTAFSMFKINSINNSVIKKADNDIESVLKPFAISTLNSHGTEISNYEFRSDSLIGEITFSNIDDSECYMKLLYSNDDYALCVLLRTCKYSDSVNKKLKDIYDSVCISPDMDIDFNHTDFFSSFDNYDEFNSYVVSGQYDIIYDMASKHIQNTDISDNDNAYTLLSTLQPIKDIWDEIDIRYDEVENYATFYYKGLDSISDSCHFVPYSTSVDRNIFVLSGFYNDDWIFFDNLLIESNDSPLKPSTFRDKIEEVKNNGVIYEAQVYTFDDSDINTFNTLDSHNIKFKNDRNQSELTYLLSSDEESAFDAISKFWDIRNAISNLAYSYYKNNTYVSNRFTN